MKEHVELLYNLLIVIYLQTLYYVSLNLMSRKRGIRRYWTLINNFKRPFQHYNHKSKIRFLFQLYRNAIFIDLGFCYFLSGWFLVPLSDKHRYKNRNVRHASEKRNFEGVKRIPNTGVLSLIHCMWLFFFRIFA